MFSLNSIACLGVNPPKATREPDSSAVQYIKQDLVFASTVDTVTWNSSDASTPLEALGFTSVFSVSPGFSGTVLATFADGAPAATKTVVKAGTAVYMGLLPGFTYFLPAMQKRPADRGATDAAYTHFVPTNFSRTALSMLVSVAGNVTKQVLTPQQCPFLLA